MYTIVKKRSGMGCASSFYKLKGQKGRGFKTFSCKLSADIAHTNQVELSMYNLAPYVYSQVGRVRKGDGSLTSWGYITEIAELICCPGNSCWCCDREELEDEYCDDINNLVCEMEEYGFNFGDCHAGNVGYVIRQGVRTMVCIDTGDESVVNEDRCYCVTCLNGGHCHE